jgi:signal transduction histidine kinase/CheY-like chemotaxis protein
VVTELAIEALFALVFVRVLIVYARGRDPLQRDVAVMFATVAVLFVLAVARQTIGEPSPVVGEVAAALLLGQPFLSVRLARRVGPMSTAVYWSALAGWLVSAALATSAGQQPGSVVIATMVVVFVVTEMVAGYFLTRLARQRRGAPRIRLSLAAAATVLFAVAIMAAGADSGGGRTSVWQLTARILALVSALAYLLAFTPPQWLVRAWSTRAASAVLHRMMRMPADAPAKRIWQCYAEAVQEATGSAAVVVLLGTPGDTVCEVARVAVPSLRDGLTVDDELLSLSTTTNLATDESSRRIPATALAYARASGARFLTVVPLVSSTGRGALLLLNPYRTLFTNDDVELLGEVSGQAAALAQRADLLSDRDRLTAELSASVDALTTASKAKSDFMANMSHELRTPLNAIIGFSDLMRGEPSTGDQTAVPTEWIGHIHSSGAHLLALINEVLDLAKVESGKVELRCEALDLPEAIGEVVTSMEALSHRKRLEVTVAVAPLRVLADRMRFRQIMTNLLSNAIKFTPEGGRIFLAGRRVGGDIAVSVADTGAGIAAADRTRVFEEFQQVGEVRAQTGGTGLGLALTRRLVQAHGGRIDLESELGHGAKFTVYLPAAGHDDRSAGSPSTGVLVIEDDVPTARLLSAYLEKAGYQVSVASTGEQGLLAARACEPEVILLDIQLPDRDGWQILSELKHDDRLRHTPVVIISALDATDVGVALGAVDYFVKPVDRQTLLSWLARHGLVPSMGTEQMTVLAIDDDPVNLHLIDTTLSAEGIQVLRASGGATGLTMARTHRVDLVICDLVMPGVDGFDVIAALHDNPRTRGIPVVVLTAHTLTETDKTRLSGKVIAITNKDAAVNGLPELARTIGELTGLSLQDHTVPV